MGDKIQMIVMCHKPAQIIHTARMSCDTIYSTTYNGAPLFKNFNETYKIEPKFDEIISDINGSYYKYTAETANELRFGMIKYNRKEKTFIIIDRDRTMIYDSRVGFLDLKTLSLKYKLKSDEIYKLIAYMRPRMNHATDEIKLIQITISSALIKFIHQKVL